MRFSYFDFPTEEIRLTPIFSNVKKECFSHTPIKSSKINDILGASLSFPEAPAHRPYLFSSYVTSIDGKIAYKDRPSPFYIAAKNLLAEGGKTADFWMLNALRAVSDASIIGGNSLRDDPEYSMHIYDKELEDARIQAGLGRVPLHIVVSLDARDIPLDHMIFSSAEHPVIIMTSPDGLAHIQRSMRLPFDILGPYGDKEFALKEQTTISKALRQISKERTLVIVTGTNSMPDTSLFMFLIRRANYRYILVESPAYGHYLTTQEFMDEFFLNMSCVYIGGDAMSLGKFGDSYTSSDHPHTEVVSAHAANAHFFFFRHLFIYNITEAKKL